ncbi:glycoside hydrolase family 25 [Segniliparus rotundus DSM 44985]|uniref:Glycoside hydrolase family 25 n=1 Tax=Segniliparus rotundus (strain ATCC BAA-972 / CDC 1076 / CIP 108378 / DSM 44985 / JCM 13578) TaxID=640132 RepID=D6Z9P7_SEGRD|nr:glycoside hydrolase family 25 protein [Segniliparus rotundus]ADG96574.1 glycoside hydrolase family 25 [Segniliparus rotundus DSM 44985]
MTDPYGLPVGSDVRQGARGFPEWVYALGAAFGLDASTYPGHQERAGLNQGIDWWPKGRADMTGASYTPAQRLALGRFALWAGTQPGVEQVIWCDPVSGVKTGFFMGERVGPGTAQPGYYRDDWSGHTGHVHTRIVRALAAPDDIGQEGNSMPLWGVDISNNNGAVDLAQVKAEGFDFVAAKVTEGTGFKDSYWPRNRDAARANDLILIGYHYVRDGDAEGQAANLAAHIGDTSVPVALDFESGSGGYANFQAVKSAVERRGMRVALSYIPRWYWQRIGSPDISDAPGLWASAYVNGTGYASVLYPGDEWSGWQPYGGGEPKILQFSSSAHVAGKSVDVNAFRGAREELLSLLGATAPAQPTASLDQLVLDQLVGPGFHGWPQLDNKSVVDFLASWREEQRTANKAMADALALLLKGTTQ